MLTKTFQRFSEMFLPENGQKGNNFSKGEICQTESFWHVESAFDSFAWNFSQTFCNIFAPDPKTFEKLYTWRKNFPSIMFSYRNVNFCFDHAVKKQSSKCQEYVRYGPKFIRRPILSEQNSSKSSWRYLESSVVNGALFFSEKIQKLLFKNPKVF